MPTDDYIKRSDALKAILGVSIYDTIEELEGARTIAENTWADGLYDAYKIIEEEVDAADVEPKRKTGHLVPIIDADIYGKPFPCGVCCSECGEQYVFEPNFCHNCGVRMMSDDEIADGTGQTFSPD